MLFFPSLPRHLKSPKSFNSHSLLTLFFYSSSSPEPIISAATLIRSPFRSHQCSSLEAVKLIHQRLIVTGQSNAKASAHVVSAYLSYDAPAHALAALRGISPNSFSVYWWNALIKRSVSRRLHEDTVELFRQMLRLRWAPDGYTYPYVLKACGEIPSYRRGASVHAHAIVAGLDCSNVFVCNALVAMYGRCGESDDARQTFDETLLWRIDDVITWNSMIAVYVQSDDYKKGLELFQSMVCAGEFELRPEAVSLVNVLPACASLRLWQRGKQVHGYAVRRGLCEDVFVGNAVVDMYAKCGLMDDAKKVFERMPVKDVVSWNAMVTGYSQIGRFDDALELFERMREDEIESDVVTWSAIIAGYAQRGLGYEALHVFREMKVSGAEPNAVTIISLLSGCAAVGALPQGKEIHCYAMKWILHVDGNDPEDCQLVINGVIDMYAKCKNLKIARAMFESIEQKDRNVVTWTAMIGGYAQYGAASDALELFSEMLKDEGSIMPNAFTVSCALVACAHVAALRFGKQIHAYVLRHSYESGVLFVANCLIDMYAKSGDIDAAKVVFDNMSERNAVSWTSLMTGYGMHGRGQEALEVFDGMRRAGLTIDGITFLVVLYACSHAGMVERGTKYFNTMSSDFGVVPGVEHYACMVDLLGRAGRLDEAMQLIKDMPLEPTPIVWVALLSACRTHGNVELGELAADKLLELESVNDGSYTLLSNIYANARRWKDVARIRSIMKHTGIKKRPGCSWVQEKKGTASFFVGDRSHPMSEEIYALLADLIDRIKIMGYVPETTFALHDVDDEEKGDLLFEHSEKLALAYGVLTSSPGAPIRITKNLRICGDCHIAFTYISRIIDHEVILRDTSRFHHFKDGYCSCKGYW